MNFNIENWLWKSDIGNFRSLDLERPGVDLPENVLFFTQLSYNLMCRLLKKSYMLSNAHILHYYAPHAWMIGKNLSMKVQVPKRGKKFYRICSQIYPDVFEITQLLSHKGGLISENAEELLLLRKMCQISILNKYMALGKKIQYTRQTCEKNKFLREFPHPQENPD